jgi:hypothetical protein
VSNGLIWHSPPKPRERILQGEPSGDLVNAVLSRYDYHSWSVFFNQVITYFKGLTVVDIFRTNRHDTNISDTSSYLDLAPLYGSSLNDQIAIRTMSQGLLKPDTFHEKRLLGQPPGVNVILVLYSRFHNHVADMLLKINENGRFSLAPFDDDDEKEKVSAIAKQDHDLFNTARL